MRTEIDQSYPDALLDLALPDDDASLSLLLLSRLSDELTTEVCEMAGALGGDGSARGEDHQSALMGAVATHQLMSALTRRFLVLWELLSATTRREVPGYVDSLRSLLYVLNAQGLVELVGGRAVAAHASGEVSEFAVTRSVLAGGHELIKWLDEMGLDVMCRDVRAQPRDAVLRVQLLCRRVADRLVQTLCNLQRADPLAFEVADEDFDARDADVAGDGSARSETTIPSFRVLH